MSNWCRWKDIFQLALTQFLTIPRCKFHAWHLTLALCTAFSNKHLKMASNYSLSNYHFIHMRHAKQKMFSHVSHFSQCVSYQHLNASRWMATFEIHSTTVPRPREASRNNIASHNLRLYTADGKNYNAPFSQNWKLKVTGFEKNLCQCFAGSGQHCLCVAENYWQQLDQHTKDVLFMNVLVHEFIIIKWSRHQSL